MNPDIPNPQSQLSRHCFAPTSRIAPSIKALPTTIAQFKTPMLRDEEDSQPYFHNGSKAKFNDVVEFYIKYFRSSPTKEPCEMPRSNSPGMSLSEADIDALVAFLMSLTEDYDDA